MATKKGSGKKSTTTSGSSSEAAKVIPLHKEYLTKSNSFTVKNDVKKDDRLSNFGKAVLKDRYLMPGESYQDLFARVACHYADDQAHATRIYDYISNL